MEIVISPSKDIFIEPKNIAAEETVFVDSFNSDSAKGLLSLAKSAEFRRRSASTSFWYEFSSEVLKHYCTIKENSDLVVKPDNDTINKFLNYCPVLRGREYLDESLLLSLWKKLNENIDTELDQFNGGFRQFIETNYSEWAQVGRINFHLAETNKGADLPFAFLATYTTRVSDKARVQHIPLGRILTEYVQKEQKDLLLSVLNPIKEAASESEFISHFVKSKKIYKTSYLDTREAYSFLTSVPSCEKSGIVVKLPKGWQGKPPSRAKVSVKVGSDTKQSFVGFNNLFSFHVNVTVGGEVLSEKEIKDLLAQNQKLTQIKGKWVEVDKDKIESLLQKWQKAARLQAEGFTFTQAMRMLAGSNITKEDEKLQDSGEQQGSWIEFTGSKQLQEVLSGMLNPSSLVSKEVEKILPKLLNATLRPYQQDGVKWLRFISKLGLGGCLADDMGLGKTIQVISLLLLEKESGAKQPNLLIAPASLLGNWESELKKFAPSLRVKILHRSQSSKEDILSFYKRCNSVDLIITTYALAKRIEWLKSHKWNCLIVDEAQAIKNPGAQQTKAIKSIDSRIRVAMTGTPIENNLTDLWSLFDFSCKPLLGSQKEFNNFVKGLKDSGASYEPLRKLVQPYIIRRKKTDKSIISDLPDKTELKSYCLLTKEQIKLYKQTIKELSDELNSDETSDMKRRGLILGYLLKFKQICNHPSQYYSDNIYDYKQSGKFYRLKELAETIASRGEKVLIFTQFKEITDILCTFLAEVFGRKGFVLHGGTPVKKRKQMVDEFQKDSSAPYFVLSIKAGGTGLNLTKASHVIHFDRWWNPAVENQATDRAFRIGQKKNVIVHKFICRGTIEEKIDLMIEDKKGLSDNVIEGSQEVRLTELSNEEILNLVSLDINSAEIN